MTLVGAAAGAAGGRKAMKEKPSQFRMKCHRNMENAVSAGTFGEKKCASTMQFVPRHTEIRHRRNIENLSACYSTAGLMNRTKVRDVPQGVRGGGQEVKEAIRARCPLCGGEIIVSEYYQTSRDYKVLMNGKLSKRYIVTDAGPINSMTASCGSFAAHTGSMRSLTFPRTECFTIKNIWKKR